MLEKLQFRAKVFVPMPFKFSFTETLVERNSLSQIASYLKQKRNLSCLDASVVDLLEGDFRFLLFYIFSEISFKDSLRCQPSFLFYKTKDFSQNFSLSEAFPSTNWMEREIYDMFGIFFSPHSDLRRILTDYGFRGHPLRKDYPVSGFTENYYSTFTKGIRVRPVSFAQMARVFTLSGVWSI